MYTALATYVENGYKVSLKIVNNTIKLFFNISKILFKNKSVSVNVIDSLLARTKLLQISGDSKESLFDIMLIKKASDAYFW